MLTACNETQARPHLTLHPNPKELSNTTPKSREDIVPLKTYLAACDGQRAHSAVFSKAISFPPAGPCSRCCNVISRPPWGPVRKTLCRTSVRRPGPDTRERPPIGARR